MVSGVCWVGACMGGKWGVVVVGLVIAGETIARSGGKGITTFLKGVFGGRDGAWALKVISISSFMCDQNGLEQLLIPLRRLLPMGLRQPCENRA